MGALQSPCEPSIERGFAMGLGSPCKALIERGFTLGLCYIRGFTMGALQSSHSEAPIERCFAMVLSKASAKPL